MSKITFIFENTDSLELEFDSDPNSSIVDYEFKDVKDYYSRYMGHLKIITDGVISIHKACDKAFFEFGMFEYETTMLQRLAQEDITQIILEDLEIDEVFTIDMGDNQQDSFFDGEKLNIYIGKQAYINGGESADEEKERL